MDQSKEHQPYTHWSSLYTSGNTRSRPLEAFDRVDHHILMTKCASLGLPTFITKWLTSFLCQRKQRVKIGSVKSEYTTVNAGVPQGTIFGPIGFLHNINDLQTVCEHIKYVDDCTLWEATSSSGMDSSVQVAADEVEQWTATNKMALNYDQTKELWICFKKSTPDIALLTIDGRPIQQVNSTCLLGVTLSEDMKWQSHIDEITTKASQRLYFIILLKRACIDPHHLINIYTSIVRSVLEYASVAHEPYKKANKTDRIHPETGNADHFPKYKSYTEAITAANLPTLSDRRSYVEHYSSACNNLHVNYTIFCLPSGKLRIQLETRGLTVCHVAELQDFRTLLFHML